METIKVPEQAPDAGQGIYALRFKATTHLREVETAMDEIQWKLTLAERSNADLARRLAESEKKVVGLEAELVKERQGGPAKPLDSVQETGDLAP